ncbi:MAG: pyridoxal phosphate-dependent aminotransferase [Prevotella sp.]|jgi:aspartate aminotransferase|nr:pyridoxal phosphate-dependent aminotransferase [Prevotella sp.]MBQ8058685.1 pyridoxal phosphate-dependent aminotransferase [Prevotella sp.]MBQ8115901.1 pyridoxal phosphate-dependent aminotransferase [Prevotella sp.]MBR4269023.1 pyridoxal phosphate-dependent aminotransferase [Prevotella sp.]
MGKLSSRLNRLAPSATLAMSQKSSEMKAQGIDVINLSVGEPDFNTPDHIKTAAKQAVDDNWSRYSPVPGYADLREAVVAKLKKENGLDYKASEILVSNGAKQAVCNAIMALVDDGEEVIVPTPYWVSYPQMVLLAGGTPVHIPAGFDQNFKITPEQLEAAITPKTRMLILCSPSNPTGSVYSKAELEGLANVIKKHPDMYVLADEIYEHINYVGKHESIAQFPGMKEQSIIINGVSKAYAMTGWRIGYMAAPEWIVKGCNKLQGQYTSGPCSVSQKAAMVAYNASQECVEDMRKAFERRRDLIVSLVKEIPGLEVNVPDGAFYVFPKCKSYLGKTDGERVIKDTNDFAMYLLEVGHVATVGGDAFGDPECFRMSYATSDDNIREAMRRIKECCAKLK